MLLGWLPDNQWEGQHTIHGAFQITLDKNYAGVAAPTDPPAMASSATSPMKLAQNEDNTFTDDESSPEEGGCSGNASSGNTDSSSNGQGIVSVQNPVEATHPFWNTHGFLMAIAWGVCAPIAIGSIMLCNVSFLTENRHWFKIHFYLNITNALFTFDGFSLAIIATNQQCDEHITDKTHKKVGFANIIIVLFHFVVAFLHPSPPRPHWLQAAKSITNDANNGTP